MSSSVLVVPATTPTPSTDAFSYPVADAVTVYTPIGRSIVKSPDPSAVAVAAPGKNDRVAPPMPAPASSTTEPSTVPVLAPAQSAIVQLPSPLTSSVAASHEPLSSRSQQAAPGMTQSAIVQSPSPLVSSSATSQSPLSSRSQQ